MAAAKRYRYCTSQGVVCGRSSSTKVTRIPAIEIECVVESRRKALLSSTAELNILFTEAETPATKVRKGLAAAQEVKNTGQEEGTERFRCCLKRTIVQDDRISIALLLNPFP